MGVEGVWGTERIRPDVFLEPGKDRLSLQRDPVRSLRFKSVLMEVVFPPLFRREST